MSGEAIAKGETVDAVDSTIISMGIVLLRTRDVIDVREGGTSQDAVEHHGR